MRKFLSILLLLIVLLFVGCESDNASDIESGTGVNNEDSKEETQHSNEQSQDENIYESENLEVYLEDLSKGDNLDGILISEVSKTKDDFYLEVDANYSIEGVLEYSDYIDDVIFRITDLEGVEKTIYGAFDYLNEDLEIEIPKSGMFYLTEEQYDSVSNQLGEDLYNFFLENPMGKVDFSANFTGYSIAGLIPGEMMSSFKGVDISIGNNTLDNNNNEYDTLAKEEKDNSPFNQVLDFKDLQVGDKVNGLTINFLEANGLDRYISFDISEGINAEGIIRYSHSKDAIVFIPVSKEGSEEERTAIWITDGVGRCEFIDIPYIGSLVLNQDTLENIEEYQSINLEKILTEDKEKQVKAKAYIKGLYVNVSNIELRFTTAGYHSIDITIENAKDLAKYQESTEMQTKGLSLYKANKSVKVFEGTDSEALLHLDSKKEVLINEDTDYTLDLSLNDEKEYFFTLKYQDVGLVEEVKNLVCVINYGPSMDYTTSLYEIENGMLKLFGTVPGKLVDILEDKNFETIYIDSTGFEAPFKLYNLPNNVWFGRTTVAFIDYQFQPITEIYKTDLEVTVLKDVSIDNVLGESISLEEGDKLKYIQSSGSEYDTSQIFVIDSESKASIGIFKSKDLKREYFDGYHIFD